MLKMQLSNRTSWGNAQDGNLLTSSVGNIVVSPLPPYEWWLSFWVLTVRRIQYNNTFQLMLKQAKNLRHKPGIRRWLRENYKTYVAIERD